MRIVASSFIASSSCTTAFCVLPFLMTVACDRPTPPPGPTTVTSASPPAPPSAPMPSPDVAAKAGTNDATSARLDSGSASAIVTFDGDVVGAAPPELEPVAGDWYVAETAGRKGLRVDGSKWQHGTPSASLADQAKRLYGDKYAEFLDGVKAFAFFPLAVATAEPPRGDVRLTIRFYPEAGRIDQAAGIAFGVAPDGSYQGVRANALENNLLYFTVKKGKRTVHENVRSVQTASKAWHTLSADIRGTHLVVNVDGEKKLDRELVSPAVGRVGLWSKADSVVTFDDFAVEPL